MAKTLDEVRNAAMTLAAGERDALIDDLINSLASEEDRAFDRHHLPEWERRDAELRSGATEAVPLEDIVRRLRAKYSDDPISKRS
jgi:putative addiction module component (TIGR02574 family)